MFKLLFRWQVLREVGRLLEQVGDAYEDNHLDSEERSKIMRQFWVLVRTARGTEK